MPELPCICPHPHHQLSHAPICCAVSASGKPTSASSLAFPAVDLPKGTGTQANLSRFLLPNLIPVAATAPLLCRYTMNLPRTEKLSDAEKDTPSHFPNTVCVGFASYRRSVSNPNNAQDGLGYISSTIFILVSRLLELRTSLALSKQASQGVPRKAVTGSPGWPDRSKIGAYINSYIYQAPEPLLLLL